MKHIVIFFSSILLLTPGATLCDGDAAWIRLKDPLDVRQVKEKEPIFADRSYTFEAFPQDLVGLSFVHGDIEATFRVEVVRDEWFSRNEQGTLE